MGGIHLKLILTRSLNGVFKTHEEMKEHIFKSKVLSQIIANVNERVVDKNVKTK